MFRRLPASLAILCLLLLLLPLLLLGCSREQMIEKASYPEDRALAVAAIRDVEQGDLAGLSSKMPPEAGPQLMRTLPLMRAKLPPPERTVEVVDARYVERMDGGGPVRRAYLAYEITGGGRFALAQVEIAREGSSAFIISIQIAPLQGPASSLAAFTLSDKGLGQWLFLLLPAAAAVVSVAALIRVWRSGQFRRRWLWTLGCLIGVTRIAMNWSTGDLFFQPFAVQLLSVSVFKPALLAPWMVSFSVPAVAIWALAHGRRSRSAVTTTFD